MLTLNFLGKLTRKKLAIVFLVSLFGFGFWYRTSLLYLKQQAAGQSLVVIKSKPIENLKNQNYFDKKQFQKQELIDAVKKFVVDSLGFGKSKVYTTYYESNDKPILYVLTACPKTSLNP